MSVHYHFTVGDMGGYTFGEYTIEQALGFAFDHLLTGEAVPTEIVADGQVVYDAAQVQVAFDTRPLDPGLVARLQAAGGIWTGNGPSRWGSYEIIAPYGHPRVVWCSPGALASMLAEWAAEGLIATETPEATEVTNG